MLHLLRDSRLLVDHILRSLNERGRRGRFFPSGVSHSMTASAVLFLLGRHRDDKGFSSEPCIIFNKRSVKVRQPGDLCFPGGRISPRLDSHLSNLLKLPYLPLACWPYWSQWRDDRQAEARRLALLFATSLRESFEEMRLNPFGVKFLVPLPSQSLQMFHRIIYPMVGWISGQKRFFPNWEVEKIVHVSLRDLLDPANYGCYRLHIKTHTENKQKAGTQDFPCFRHQDQNEKEVLWGATYFIVMAFLEFVFGFKPPDIDSLPVVYGTLDENYVTGAG